MRLHPALARRLQSDRGPLWLALIALLVSLPALRLPFEMDDHWMRANHALRSSPFELMGGVEPNIVPAARAAGTLAWWTSDTLRIHFWRPLSSLSHWLDLELWGDRPLPMHALNVLLYALLVLVAASTYRLLSRAAGDEAHAAHALVAAALAGLMFAVDDSHAPNVGWISGRNTLLAALFAFSAMRSHALAHLDGERVHALLSPLALGLALLSGESGLQGAAYLVLYALLLDRRAAAVRVRSLAMHAIVVGIWAAYYVTHDFGGQGSDWYSDPVHEPLRTLVVALWDAPLWLGSMFVVSFATPSLFADEIVARAVWLLLIAALLPLHWQAVRASKLARFYAGGALLSALPLLLTRPQDRLLIMASFGVFGCFGIALASTEASSAYSRRALRVTFGLNLVLAPLLYLAMLGQAEPLERSTLALAPLLQPRGRVKEIVALNLPIEIVLQYARAQRLAAGEPLPERLRLLYAGGSPLIVERPDARTLELTATTGLLANPMERMFTTLDDGRAFRAGQRIELPGLRIEILSVTARDGAPQRVRYVFDSTLEDAQRSFLAWQGQHPVPWTPPAIGKRLELPALSALRSLTPR